jgi:hypothetical protein
VKNQKSKLPKKQEGGAEFREPESPGESIFAAEAAPQEQEQEPALSPKRPPWDASTSRTMRTSDARLKQRLPRSGGPQTDEGKVKSSRNSRKHGAYATHLPENDGYYALMNAARLELQPRGFIETAITETIAHEIYRSKSIEEAEKQRIRASEFKRLDPSEVARRMDFPFGQEFYHLLVDTQNSVRLMNDFCESWKELAAPPVAGAAGELETKEDGSVVRLYKTACELLKSAELNPYAHEEFLEKIDAVMAAAMRGENYLGRRIADKGREVMLVNYWLIVNKTELSVCMHDMRNEHKLEILTDEKLSRAKKHVNSNLTSGLNQFAALRNIKHVTDERIFQARIKKT